MYILEFAFSFIIYLFNYTTMIFSPYLDISFKLSLEQGIFQNIICTISILLSLPEIVKRQIILVGNKKNSDQSHTFLLTH